MGMAKTAETLGLESILVPVVDLHRYSTFNSPEANHRYVEQLPLQKVGH
jgi:hypothetical protein